MTQEPDPGLRVSYHFQISTTFVSFENVESAVFYHNRGSGLLGPSEGEVVRGVKVVRLVTLKTEADPGKKVFDICGSPAWSDKLSALVGEATRDVIGRVSAFYHVDLLGLVLKRPHHLLNMRLPLLKIRSEHILTSWADRDAISRIVIRFVG